VLREPESTPQPGKVLQTEAAGRTICLTEASKHVRSSDTKKFRDFQALVAVVYAELVTR